MTWPYYTGTLKKKPNEPIKVPQSLQAVLGEAAGYIPDDGLVHAANTAILLAQPLLLTGDPGCGKTRFAASLAFELGLGDPLEFRAKTSSKAQDLLYVHDALARLQATHAGDKDTTALKYIRLGALGEAVLRASDPQVVPKDIRNYFEHKEPSRHLVLIDEIDKAPRDFCNDLLTEIERKNFSIRELDEAKLEAHKDYHPVVVITSNSEQHLPPAFLRRCIYYHIPFPPRPKLEEIVDSRLGERISLTKGRISAALTLFEELREDEAGLTKRPATAELLGWLLALNNALPGGASIFESPEHVLDITKDVLLKNKSDRDRAHDEIESYANAKV